MFKAKILFPTWQIRTEILDYCTSVAATPDPDDPETTIRAAESQKDKQRVVNERLDPYSGRFFPMEPRTQKLATLLRTESGIENVVRTRTWKILKARCGEDQGDWQAAFGAWRKTERTKEQGQQ